MADSLGTSRQDAGLRDIMSLLTEVRHGVRRIAGRVDLLEEKSKRKELSGEIGGTGSDGQPTTTSETSPGQLDADAEMQGQGDNGYSSTSVTKEEQEGESNVIEELSVNQSSPGGGADEVVNHDSEEGLSVQQHTMQIEIAESMDELLKFMQPMLDEGGSSVGSLVEDIKNSYVKNAAQEGIEAAVKLCTEMRVLKDEKTNEEWSRAVDFVELLVITLVESVEFFISDEPKWRWLIRSLTRATMELKGFDQEVVNDLVHITTTPDEDISEMVLGAEEKQAFMNMAQFRSEADLLANPKGQVLNPDLVFLNEIFKDMDILRPYHTDNEELKETMLAVLVMTLKVQLFFKQIHEGGYEDLTTAEYGVFPGLQVVVSSVTRLLSQFLDTFIFEFTEAVRLDDTDVTVESVMSSDRTPFWFFFWCVLPFAVVNEFPETLHEILNVEPSMAKTIRDHMVEEPMRLGEESWSFIVGSAEVSNWMGDGDDVENYIIVGIRQAAQEAVECRSRAEGVLQMVSARAAFLQEIDARVAENAEREAADLRLAISLQNEERGASKQSPWRTIPSRGKITRTLRQATTREKAAATNGPPPDATVSSGAEYSAFGHTSPNSPMGSPPPTTPCADRKREDVSTVSTGQDPWPPEGFFSAPPRDQNVDAVTSQGVSSRPTPPSRQDPSWLSLSSGAAGGGAGGGASGSTAKGVPSRPTPPSHQHTGPVSTSLSSGGERARVSEESMEQKLDKVVEQTKNTGLKLLTIRKGQSEDGGITIEFDATAGMAVKTTESIVTSIKSFCRALCSSLGATLHQLLSGQLGITFPGLVGQLKTLWGRMLQIPSTVVTAEAALKTLEQEGEKFKKSMENIFGTPKAPVKILDAQAMTNQVRDLLNNTTSNNFITNKWVSMLTVVGTPVHYLHTDSSAAPKLEEFTLVVLTLILSKTDGWALEGHKSKSALTAKNLETIIRSVGEQPISLATALRFSHGRWENPGEAREMLNAITEEEDSSKDDDDDSLSVVSNDKSLSGKTAGLRVQTLDEIFENAQSESSVSDSSKIGSASSGELNREGVFRVMLIMGVISETQGTVLKSFLALADTTGKELIAKYLAAFKAVSEGEQTLTPSMKKGMMKLLDKVYPSRYRLLAKNPKPDEVTSEFLPATVVALVSFRGSSLHQHGQMEFVQDTLLNFRTLITDVVLFIMLVATKNSNGERLQGHLSKLGENFVDFVQDWVNRFKIYYRVARPGHEDQSVVHVDTPAKMVEAVQELTNAMKQQLSRLTSEELPIMQLYVKEVFGGNERNQNLFQQIETTVHLLKQLHREPESDSTPTLHAKTLKFWTDAYSYYENRIYLRFFKGGQRCKDLAISY